MFSAEENCVFLHIYVQAKSSFLNSRNKFPGPSGKQEPSGTDVAIAPTPRFEHSKAKN